MKTFEVDVNINGKITFEVQAHNKKAAQAKVDELLGNTALKEALEKYQNNITLNSKVRDNRDLERQKGDYKMPYQKRIPPVKVELSIEKFNLLVEMLTRYTQMSNERVAQLATKMKDKLLRYSIPRTEEEQ